MLKAKLLGATAGAEFLAVEEVFQSWLYTGNGSTQTITNGIDLAGEGGLVWIKGRSGATDHQLFDTLRGATKELISNSTAAETTDTDTLTAFNANGFSLGADATTNTNAATYASWTFRKAPRFFDVVTYTGNGTNGRQIAHSLGQSVGACIIKRTDSTGDWAVWHRSGGYNGSSHLHGVLNYSDVFDNYGYFNTSLDQSTYFTSTYFTVQSQSSVNASGGTYVAYLYAHDPLGPSGDGSDGLIACGSYTGNGSTDGPTITLGWEPQWIMVKRTDSTSNWRMYDVMRELSWSNAKILAANTSAAESDYGGISPFLPLPTGFKNNYNDSGENASGGTYVYIAIRRGPMREPTVGTEVFATGGLVTGLVENPAFVSGFVTDAGMRIKKSGGTDHWMSSRLQGPRYMETTNTTAEQAASSAKWDYMNGWYDQINDNQILSYMFRRAPGFFDVVAYTGDGTSNRQINHNLGVVPELVITKIRSGGTGGWWTRAGLISQNQILRVDQGGGFVSLSGNADTSTTFNSFLNNSAGTTNIAYLFASLPGISKVGSYTGNGSSQTINCAFTTGARFILIKRTDSTGDWYVWDTARGIVSGNDPHLSLNTTAVEVTTNDTIDPDSTGFIVNQVAATNVNVNAASYIYLAIA